MNEYTAGSTSIVEIIDLMDSTKTDGSGKTGLAYNTSGLTCYYKRSNGTASVPVTLASIATLGTFVSGGFKEIDATNMPGAYEFHPPNAAFASGAKEVTFYFQGATGLARRPIKYRILAVDPDTAGANGIYPSDAKAINAIATTSVTTISANVGTTQPVNFTGTGTTAYVKAGLWEILGTVLTETAGFLAAGFKKFFNVSATPTSTMDHLTLLDTVTTYTGNTPQTGDSYGIVNSGSFGNSALLSAIQNVQNNTFIATSIPMTLERPDSSSTSISISIVFSDETGTAKNLDSGSPAITLLNDAGTDRSGRLGAITNPATGKYVVVYTNTSTDPIEGLHWDISGTINSKLRRMVAYTQIVDTTAVDFTSSDRTQLQAIYNKLPSGNIADSSTQTTILNRLGSFVGDSVSNVWAYLKKLGGA